MPHSTFDLSGHNMVALSRDALATLRSALLRDAGPSAADCLREAGYAGGETVFRSFLAWLAERGEQAPEDLDAEQFQYYASMYFSDAGWGTLTLTSLQDAVVMVDSPDWGEADPSVVLDQPSCHLTTGMLADFFGRVSETPVAVLEVECRSAGAHRCRFLLGNSEVMTYVYEELERGTAYEDALALVE
jgi:predicted hydrocarbon binding protein